MKKQNRIIASVAGTAIAALLFASPASADESQSQPVKEETQSSTVAFTYGNTLSDFEFANQTKPEAPVSPFNITPVEFEEVENLASVTGFNPIHFPSTDLSKIVRDWKVVGEQYLREDTDLESEIVRILKEDQELEIIQKEDDEWYKVKIVEPIKVNHEGKVKKEEKETIGFISSKYIQLMNEEEEQKIEAATMKETKLIQAKLKTEIEREVAEEERKRIEEEKLAAEKEAKRLAEEAEAKRIEKEAEVKRLATEKAAKEKAEQLAKAKAEQVAKTKQVAKVSQVAKAPQQAAAKQAAPQSSGSSNVLANGSKYIGAGYLFGASTSRTDVFDCSSFTLRVFAEAGINLPRNSAAQASMGTTVSKANLQPGDLVFFNTSGSGISHVGIYAGNGKFLGSQSSTGVAYADMNNSYWGPRYITAKRIR